MQLEKLINPMSTNYHIGELDFEVCFQPELVRSILSPKQIDQILKGCSSKTKTGLPANELHEIFVKMIESSTDFLDYRICHGFLNYRDLDMIWITQYDISKLKVIVDINLLRYGRLNNSTCH